MHRMMRHVTPHPASHPMKHNVPKRLHVQIEVLPTAFATSGKGELWLEPPTTASKPKQHAHEALH